MRILRQISDLAEATQSLAQAMRSHLARLEAGSPAEARLEELERSRMLWEAEMEALLLKAESTLKSANNAESRARTMVKHYEKNADPFDEDSEEEFEPVPEGYAPASPEEEVHPMHLDLAPDHKSPALNRKWGIA